MEAANTLGVLGMYSRAAETVIKSLSDFEPTTRAHAVTSLVNESHYLSFYLRAATCAPSALMLNLTLVPLYLTFSTLRNCPIFISK